MDAHQRSFLLVFATLCLSVFAGKGFDVYPRDDAIVVDRSPVTLHCQSRDEDVARSASSSSYEWFLNDESIVNTSANRHEVFANGSLHYEALSTASGPSTPLRYTCKSTRQSGTVVSDVATIRFAYIDDYSPSARSAIVNAVPRGTAFLQCPSPTPTGLPSSRVVWIDDRTGAPVRNRLPVSSLTNNLQIPNVNSSLDETTYRCEYINDMLNRSTISPPVTLKVGATSRRLSLLSSQESHTVLMGGRVLFECVPFSATVATTTWSLLFNGSRVGPSTVRSSTIGTNLKIVNVRKEDEGEYECEASAPPLPGTSQPQYSYKYFLLTVDEIPIVSVTPSAEALSRFLLYSIKCSVRGKPTPTAYWTLNGFKLTDVEMNELGIVASSVVENDEYQLKISKVDHRHEGYYQCFASNLVGSTNAAALLIVYYPPDLVLSPQPADIFEGTSLVLNCSYSGSPPPTITWFLDDVELNNAIGGIEIAMRRGDRLTTSSLRVVKATNKHTGIYSCRGVNPAATVSPGGVKVTVYVGADVSVPDQVAGHLGASLLIVARVVGLPKPTIQWYVNETRLLSDRDNRIRVLPNGSLEISNLLIDDATTYKVVVTNVVRGAETSQMKRVGVSIIPVVYDFDSTPPHYLIGQESVRLRCRARANPLRSLSFTWWKGNVVVVETTLITVETVVNETDFTATSVLTIRRVAEEDYGNYSCSATNAGGQSPKTIIGYIDAPDVISEAPRQSERTGLSDGGVAGIVITMLILTSVVIVMSAYVYRYRQKKSAERSDGTPPPQLESVMRYSQNQASAVYYASSGPHSREEDGKATATTAAAAKATSSSGAASVPADKDISFQSFAGNTVLGRRSTADTPTTPLNPLRIVASPGDESIAPPAYSPNPEEELDGQILPSATSISTDIDSCCDVKPRYSYLDPTTNRMMEGDTFRPEGEESDKDEDTHISSAL